MSCGTSYSNFEQAINEIIRAEFSEHPVINIVYTYRERIAKEGKPKMVWARARIPGVDMIVFSITTSVMSETTVSFTCVSKLSIPRCNRIVEQIKLVLKR